MFLYIQNPVAFSLSEPLDIYWTSFESWKNLNVKRFDLFMWESLQISLFVELGFAAPTRHFEK